MCALKSVEFNSDNSSNILVCSENEAIFKFLDCISIINDSYKGFIYIFSINDVVITYNIECMLYSDNIHFSAKLNSDKYTDFINRFVVFESDLYIEEIIKDINYLIKLDDKYTSNEYFSLLLYGFLCGIFINNGVFYELSDMEWYKVFYCLEEFINNIFNFYRYNNKYDFEIPMFSISDKNYILNYDVVDYKLDYNKGFPYNLVSEITYVNSDFALPLYTFLNRFSVLVFDSDLIYEYYLGNNGANNMCTNILELNIRSYIIGYISNILLFEFKKYPSIVEKYIDKFNLYIQSSKEYYYRNCMYEYPSYEIYVDNVNEKYINSHLNGCNTNNIFKNNKSFEKTYVKNILSFYNYGKVY